MSFYQRFMQAGTLFQIFLPLCLFPLPLHVEHEFKENKQKGSGILILPQGSSDVDQSLDFKTLLHIKPCFTTVCEFKDDTFSKHLYYKCVFILFLSMFPVLFFI